MLYVADTMARVWHLEKRRRLGAQARKVLQEADQGLLTNDPDMTASQHVRTIW